jgi:hypothetical protein
MTEKELLIDCLIRLNRVGIPYMLTGSMASNYWGIPRTTHDLDFVVQIPESAISVLVASFSMANRADHVAGAAPFAAQMERVRMDL